MANIYIYSASSSVLFSDNTERTVVSASYVLIVTLTMPSYFPPNKTISINYDYCTHYYDRFVNLAIYKNGTYTGITSGNLFSTTWQTKAIEYLSGVYAGDNIQLYGKNDSGNSDWWGKIRNYRIYGTLTPGQTATNMVRGHNWIKNY